jgi:hypothetical protein
MKSRRPVNSSVVRLLFMTQTPERIQIKISEGVASLAPHLRSWVDEHLIAPRQVRFALDANGTSIKDLWLVSDHVGANDSSYRIVYDDETDAFGLECTLDSGVEWYMGNYSSFAETVENM